jgi:hypothetical protein
MLLLDGASDFLGLRTYCRATRVKMLQHATPRHVGAVDPFCPTAIEAVSSSYGHLWLLSADGDR